MSDYRRTLVVHPRAFGKSATMVAWAAQHLTPDDLLGDQSRHFRQRYVLGPAQVVPLSDTPAGRSVVMVSRTHLEDTMTRLATHVTPADLHALVTSGCENGMDLAHLLLHVEMPPQVGDMTLADYVRALDAACADGSRDLDRLLDLGAAALSDAR